MEEQGGGHLSNFAIMPEALALAMACDTFNRNTRNKPEQFSDAQRELMTPSDPPKRPIGFATPEDKGKGKTQAARSGEAESIRRTRNERSTRK